MRFLSTSIILLMMSTAVRADILSARTAQTRAEFHHIIATYNVHHPPGPPRTR